MKQSIISVEMKVFATAHTKSMFATEKQNLNMFQFKQGTILLLQVLAVEIVLMLAAENQSVSKKIYKSSFSHELTA